MNFVQTEPIEIDRQSIRGPVAIVGIGCRFPGRANSPSAFWKLLKNKICAICEVPSDRWNAERFYSPHPDAPMKAISKWGGFTREMWDFDAEFFGISPREAEAMDPQQRIFLLVTWEAFEDAGIAPDRLAGSNTGVFVGISTTDYQGFQGKVGLDTDLSHSCTGAAPSIVSNRVSNRLNFQGPSMSIDTACSSSLVAAELACRNLWSRDCDVAVAGGVNALLLPQVYVNFSKARMLSPTGRVLTFDARADGFVRAEGAGAVILKRLDDAIAHGDRIYAVITATAVNQDGYTSTLTLPSAEAQAKMLRQVCRDAGIAPEDVGYVEAHGTGTPVGDPIEASAIGSVFALGRDRSNRLLVGSVKTNVGHLESGAGVCGLIKTALSVYHGEIPANPNFETVNPNIPLDKLNIDIVREHSVWHAKGRRRAVVNSFGFGGTNASAVVEQAPALPAPIPRVRFWNHLV
jgi:acyl transferase domain-containing protein